MAKKNQLTTSDYLEYQEYEKLLSNLRANKEYVWELYARLGFCTACRASDVLNLKWSDILGKSEHVIVEQKTKKARKLTFNNSVQNKIKELYKLIGQPDKEEFIFLSRTTNKPITIQYLNKKLKAFKSKYKIKIGNFSTHTFRKTFGRYVYEKYNRSAESLILLNKILNHSNIAVTKTYIGITQDEVNSIFNSIAF
jgi:integrase